jgi:predicted phosphate transport protein (TIGR00153 family)
MFRLFPKDQWFFDKLGQASRNVTQACSIFLDMLQHTHESSLLSYTQRIKELEHEGDHLTHEVVDRLNKSFLTPFDREDIFMLASRLDDVMDMLDGAASRILRYRIGTPPPKLLQQVKVLENATSVMHTLVSSLQPKLNYANIHHYFEQVHLHENEGDQLLREAVSELFETEKDPIQVIKLKEIYEFVEAAIDKCEDVANVIEGICVKHA